jgi:hypothetical protein
MTGKDSSRESQIPSSPAKEPNTGNPIVVGLLGIFLVALAGVGGGYLHTHPKLPLSPGASPELAQVARAAPAPVDAPPAKPASVNSPSEVNSTVVPPSTIPESPAPKRLASDAKKTPPKASVKETSAAILPHPTQPAQPASSAPQPPEPQPSSPAPPPTPEKHEETKEPPITAQPAPLITVKASDGLPIRILLTEDVPEDAPNGQTLKFVVADSVQIDNTTIIAKGAVVTASIADRKKKILGIGSAKVTYQLRTVHSVDDKQLKVRATSGHNSDGTSTNQFDPPKGPEKKRFAALQGTEYVAYIDTDQTVAVRK